MHNSIQSRTCLARKSLDAYKGTTPFAFRKIYSVIIVSCGNKCLNVKTRSNSYLNKFHLTINDERDVQFSDILCVIFF